MAHNCFFLTQIQDYKRIVISFKRLFNIPNIGGFVIWHIIYVIAIFETQQRLEKEKKYWKELLLLGIEKQEKKIV